MPEQNTRWRWEFTDGFHVTSRGPWRDTREEACADGKGTKGWLSCEVETAQVDEARWRAQERERER